MANRTIDPLDTLHRNRNAIVLDRALRERRVALVPELVWEQRVQFTDLRDLGTSTQTATTTVGNTVNLAEYSIQITGTGTDDAAVDETYVYEAVAGDTATDVADAIAALIDADCGEGNPLEFLVASSANVAGVITTIAVTGASFTVTPTITYHEQRTVTVGGSDISGVYNIIVATTPPTTVTATATGMTTEDIANALEADMEDKRDGTISAQLDGVVLDESDAAAVVTVVFEYDEEVAIATEHPATATLVVADSTPDDSTLTNVDSYAIELDMNTAWPNNAFPGTVERNDLYVEVNTAFSGTTTLEVGDANDPNGLLTSTSIAATGNKETITAAEVAERIEASFAPLLTVTSTLHPSAMTAGDMWIRLEFTPLVSV